MRMLYSTILASCVCCEMQHRIRSGCDAMQHAPGGLFFLAFIFSSLVVVVVLKKEVMKKFVYDIL